MKNVRLNLLYAVSSLSLIVMMMPEVQAANIGNGVTVTAPPTVNQAMNFTAPAPGGTFVIEAGITFVGALTSDGGAAIGTLVLNNASLYQGAVGDPSISTITLNGNANIIGATGAAVFNLGQNTLTNTGALNLPSGIILNTKVVSDSIFGNIGIGGATDSIAGASIQVNVDASGATPGSLSGAPLFIVAAGAGTNGLPVNVTSNNILYSFSGLNTTGNIEIIPTYHPIALPSTVGAVFTALLTVAANNPGSDIANVMAAVVALPTPTAIADALAQFNPTADGALTRMSFDSTKQFQQLWALHMTNGRCVYAQECDCYTRNENGEYVDSEGNPLSHEKQAECEKRRKAACDSSINCNTVSNRWEIWADGFGLWGHQKKRQGFNAYSANLYGGMIAAQGPITRELSAGFGGGYANTHVDRVHGGHSMINTYDGTAYLSYNPTHWYLDAAFSFDFNRYRDQRRIQFTGVDRIAKAEYVGRQYTGLVAGGYRFYKWCSIFTPLASLQYSYLSVNKYHEHGAGDLDLNVNEQHYNFLESSLGWKVARPVQTRRGAFVPEVHALWLHDFFGDAQHLQTTFSSVASEAPITTTNEPTLARNRGDVGAGVTFISCINLAVEAVYNYEFSNRWHAHQGLVKLSKQF